MACIKERIKFEFDTTDCGYPTIIQVGDGGTNFLISYAGASGYATLKHIEVLEDGSISVLDTLIHSSGSTSYHCLSYLPTLDQGGPTGGLFFLLTYINSAGYVYYKSVKIGVADDEISILDYDWNQYHSAYVCAFPDTTPIADGSNIFMTIYSVVEDVDFSSLWIGKVTIGTGLDREVTIGLTQEIVSTDPNRCEDGRIITIDDTHLLVTYSTGENSAVVRARTYSHDSGTTLSKIDEEDLSTWAYPHDVIKVTSFYYLLAVRDTIITFGVNSTTYVISSAISTLDYTTETPQYLSLTQLDTYKFMLAYKTSDNDGWVRIFTGTTSYVMTDYADLEHETVNCDKPKILGIGSNYAIMVYQGTDGDGFAKTFGPCTSLINISDKWRDMVANKICIDVAGTNTWKDVNALKVCVDVSGTKTWKTIYLASEF